MYGMYTYIMLFYVSMQKQKTKCFYMSRFHFISEFYSYLAPVFSELEKSETLLWIKIFSITHDEIYLYTFQIYSYQVLKKKSLLSLIQLSFLYVHFIFRNETVFVFSIYICMTFSPFCSPVFTICFIPKCVHSTRLEFNYKLLFL